MDAADRADAQAFWDHVQRQTKQRFASWPMFSAYFLTYMQLHYPGEAPHGPDDPSTEMVLRYAFDRGAPSRAQSSRAVVPKDLNLFLQRFGPMKTCLVKASRSLFDENGCLERWFHGTMSREKAGQAIQEWEASNGKKHGGVFLFRYTSNRAEIAFSYRRKAREDPHHSLIVNGAAGYFLAQDQSRVWADLREFVSVMGRTFVRPVPSALYEECVMELREPQEIPEPPVDHIARARELFQNAQEMACRDPENEFETARVLEEALELVSEALSIVRRSESGAPQLEAKILRLDADILWKLGRRAEGVTMYERYLDVVTQMQEDKTIADGSSHVAWGTLLYVHRLLATYYLGRGEPNRALHHFSEVIACSTDEETRKSRVEEFREMEAFRNATATLSHGSVEEMLTEGISYFRRQDYAPAAEKFEMALRDARCIGEGKLEARALGNVATVDFKTHRIPAAIRRYKTCVQLLRQLRDQVTERKILNYLVMCCIEDQRWAPAKLFHEQLSLLAESNENIEHLKKLWAKIQDGINAQAAEEAARTGSTHGTFRDSADAGRSSFPPEPGDDGSYGRAGQAARGGGSGGNGGVGTGFGDYGGARAGGGGGGGGYGEYGR